MRFVFYYPAASELVSVVQNRLAQRRLAPLEVLWYRVRGRYVGSASRVGRLVGLASSGFKQGLQYATEKVSGRQNGFRVG